LLPNLGKAGKFVVMMNFMSANSKFSSASGNSLIYIVPPPPPLNKCAREGVAQLNQHSVAQENLTQENKRKGCFSRPSVRLNKIASESVSEKSQNAAAQENLTQENKRKGCFSRPSVRLNKIASESVNQFANNKFSPASDNSSVFIVPPPPPTNKIASENVSEKSQNAAAQENFFKTVKSRAYLNSACKYFKTTIFYFPHALYMGRNLSFGSYCALRS
jgi:hypothetical protein